MRSRFLGIAFWREYSFVCFSSTGYSTLRGVPFPLWRFCHVTKFLFWYSFVFSLRFRSVFKRFCVETTEAKVQKRTDENIKNWITPLIPSMHATMHAFKHTLWLGNKPECLHWRTNFPSSCFRFRVSYFVIFFSYLLLPYLLAFWLSDESVALNSVQHCYFDV